MGRTLVSFLASASMLTDRILKLAISIIRFLISLIIDLLVVLRFDLIILRMYKAKPALEDYASIQEKVKELSMRRGIRMPSVYITQLPLPGSFVIGRSPDKAKLIFPERLMGLLNNKELEAILAYNIVQINSNICMRSVVALLAGILTMTASAVRWLAVYTGFGDYNEPAPRLLGLFVMGLVAPPAATMIHLVAEDYDADAISLLEDPHALISAIERLESNNTSYYHSLGFLCLVDARYENVFEHLFCVHPSKEIRIRNIGIKNDRITS